MIDRNTPPPLKPLENVDIPELNRVTLPGGLRLNYLDTGCRDLIRVDMMCRSGALFQPRPLVAMLTNLLLKEGCRGMNSAEIAEKFDSYGAFLYYSYGMEYTYINLCTPKKFYAPTLSLLRDIWQYPTFPAHDLKVVLEQRYQQMKVDREKVKVMSSLKMNELLFGASHPYGRMLQESDFDNFDRQLLADYHARYYRPERTQLVLTGDVDQEVIDVTSRVFGNEIVDMARAPQTQDGPLDDYPQTQPSPQRRCFLPKEQSLQAAVRLSLPTVGQDHPDFMGLKVLNAILGGYFGSRLMTTVREEKGYTYGIFSTHTVYRNQSYIDIETQTAIEYVKPLIEAVFQEMEKLKQEPAGAEEMQLLRNYLSGEYARMMDGPFALADLYIAAESVGMDMASYRQQLDVMNRISGEELQALAQKYFHEEDFYLVCAGGTQSPF